MHGLEHTLLSITLLLVHVFAATPQGTTPTVLSSDVAQLSNALKLLKLQLKQSSETAEHVSALLTRITTDVGMQDRVEAQASVQRGGQIQSQPQTQWTSAKSGAWG